MAIKKGRKTSDRGYWKIQGGVSRWVDTSGRVSQDQKTSTKVPSSYKPHPGAVWDAKRSTWLVPGRGGAYQSQAPGTGSKPTTSSSRGYAPLTEAKLSSESRFEGGIEEGFRAVTIPNARGDERRADLVQDLQQQQEESRQANEARYAKGLQLYDRIIRTFEEGGAFERASLEELNRQKFRDVASIQSGLIGAGLAGTTPYATAAQKYETEVGVPTRLGIRAAASDRLTQALMGKAGFIERRTDTGPSYRDLAAVSG